MRQAASGGRWALWRDRLAVVGLVALAVLSVRCVTWQRTTGRFERDPMETSRIDPFERCVAVTAYFSARRDLTEAAANDRPADVARAVQRIDEAWTKVLVYIRDYRDDSPLPVRAFVHDVKTAPDVAAVRRLDRDFARQHRAPLDELDGDVSQECARR